MKVKEKMNEMEKALNDFLDRVTSAVDKFLTAIGMPGPAVGVYEEFDY